MSWARATVLAFFFTATLWVVPGLAQDRQALVVSTQPETREVVDLSEQLFGLGFTVTRLERPEGETLSRAISGIATLDGPVLVYVLGPAAPEMAWGIRANDSDVSLAALAERPFPTFIFVDTCSMNASSALEPLPEDVGTGPVLLATPAAQDGLCLSNGTPVIDGLLDRLSLPGNEISDVFEDEDVVVVSTLSEPFIPRPVASDLRLTADDYEMLESLPQQARADMIALWREAGIPVDLSEDASAQVASAPTVTVSTVVVTSPVRPVQTNERVSPVTVRPVAVSSPSSNLRIFEASVIEAPAVFRAPAGVDGRPAPSIIIGELAPTEASFDIGPELSEQAVSGNEIAYDDLEARRALKESDPALFENLVQVGAFDPSEDDLVIALQTELSRMRCYTSGIDGQWGPGSRASVGRYYDQVDGAAPTQDPDVRVFRQILLEDDVECPVVVSAPRPSTTTSSGSSTRTTTTRTTTSTTRSQPSTSSGSSGSSGSSTSTRRINQNTGTGVFR